jgi:hypothetical protein
MHAYHVSRRSPGTAADGPVLSAPKRPRTCTAGAPPLLLPGEHDDDPAEVHICRGID